MADWLDKSIAHWERRISELNMGCDWSDARNHCWRCGRYGKHQKCHIVPKSLGGNNNPENLMLLCTRCHDEMPDVPDPMQVWAWIEREHSELAGDMWSYRAVRSVQDAGVDFGRVDLNTLAKNIKTLGVHGGQHGQGAFIKPSSMAWAIEKSVETPNSSGVEVKSKK